MKSCKSELVNPRGMQANSLPRPHASLTNVFFLLLLSLPPQTWGGGWGVPRKDARERHLSPHASSEATSVSDDADTAVSPVSRHQLLCNVFCSLIGVFTDIMMHCPDNNRDAYSHCLCFYCFIDVLLHENSQVKDCLCFQTEHKSDHN